MFLVLSNFIFLVYFYWVEFEKLIEQVRHRLRKDHGIDGGIPVVFSLEKPKAKLLPFKGPSGEEENPSDYQVRIDFEVLILAIAIIKLRERYISENFKPYK